MKVVGTNLVVLARWDFVLICEHVSNVSYWVGGWTAADQVVPTYLQRLTADCSCMSWRLYDQRSVASPRNDGGCAWLMFVMEKTTLRILKRRFVLCCGVPSVLRLAESSKAGRPRTTVGHPR